MALSPTSSRGSSGPTAAQTLLSSTTLSGSGTFDVSSIDQTYSDLLLVIIARGTNASASDNLDIRFNNDSSAHYGKEWINATGATVSSNESNSATSAYVLLNMQANTAGAGQFAMGWVYIPGYASTTWPKMFVSHNLYGTAITTGARSLAHVFGYWNQTAAINRVQVFGDTTANLATGSVLRIYGVS